MKTNQTVFRQINNLTHQLKRCFNIYFDNIGITGVQASILHFIMIESKYRDVFQKDIEEEFKVRRSSATNILQVLEKGQYIRRETIAYDARLKKIVLTAKTIELDKIIMEHIVKINERMLQNIPSDKLQDFQEVLSEMSRNLD
ncbi:MAG: MarR family transcriptional regulator [Selenomonadaceae bacterium]